MQNQFEKQIKIVRNDNPKKLFEEDAFHFFLENGIIHQSSCVDKPKVTGVEIKHRHLLEDSKALNF